MSVKTSCSVLHEPRTLNIVTSLDVSMALWVGVFLPVQSD